MTNETSNAPSAPSDEGRGPISFSVEIRGGRTGFRRRPILGDRFLVGSDPVCDLRVDDRIAAPLHCLLRRDGDQLEVECLAGSKIHVNGVSVDHAVIGDGETLAIGSVRLTIHTHAMRFDVVCADDDAMAFTSTRSEPVADYDRRTAADVVDLLELEHERLQEFDDRRRAGASALLDVIRHTKRPATEAVVALSGPSPEELLSRLGSLTAALERQSLCALDDATDVRKAAAELLAAQRTLLGQADKLLRLTSALADARRSRAVRAA